LQSRVTLYSCVTIGELYQDSLLEIAQNRAVDPVVITEDFNICIGNLSDSLDPMWCACLQGIGPSSA